ncbi:tRNA uridine-5-carboxymethylaminomethyl(34) synthesis GTPase MnmE [Rhizobium oryzicola]|uniref:tRNA modification GTPase MnmE n=1 Tax=Rhizobium oryzicola TaxID=1232668 RepID=A0ABT8T2T1_9HYPH|nr:tRNA uridine-5-carboxymethylaminomethyl(34) synthesis GTPase MnmE [Rhizobium oryzicola]MDO1584734.1 tRNA uridine-5-carboxymethylaminomethyl(34) synthesis GTPase MnmE [Rhizobium oryzicola]
MQLKPTIFALSSGATPSGVAVLRLSGPDSFSVAETLSGHLPTPRMAALKSIRTRNGDLLDRGLVLCFPGPASFTGEDCIEFHLHGGRAVVDAVSRELLDLGIRPAEAGEFTKRAFENGKLDLVEVEGLGDLISAETEMQRRLAIEHTSGGLSAVYAGWADRLTRARALIEAELDFADEEDIPGSVSDQVWDDVERLKADIKTQLEATQHGAFVRNGFRVVISGPPNAGKSSLLNALAKRDVAIVTEIAGTTRDILEVDLNLEGFLVRLVDTAGLRETEDIVEQEGVRRARSAIETADLILALIPIDSDAEWNQTSVAAPVLKVGTKADLLTAPSIGYDLVISSKDGSGISALIDAITSEVRKRWNGIAAIGPGRLRHVQHLKHTSFFLEEALSGTQLDLRAESLRLAGECLGRITGRVDPDDMLGVIFSEFCIGK